MMNGKKKNRSGATAEKFLNEQKVCLDTDIIYRLGLKKKKMEEDDQFLKSASYSNRQPK